MKKEIKTDTNSLIEHGQPQESCPFTSLERALHKSQNKYAIYQAKNKLWWSDELERWLCFDANLIKEILMDDDFEVMDYFSTHEMVTIRLNVNLEHTTNVLSNIPFCHDGITHRELKKIYSKEVIQHQKSALLQFEHSLQNLVNLKFRSGNSVDLVGEVIAPAVGASASLYSIIKYQYEGNAASIGQILDETIGISRRIKINKKIEEIISLLPENIPKEMKYVQVGLAAAGIDALVGTLSESIAFILSKNTNLKLSEIDWDQAPPATGIPFTERIIKVNKTISGSELCSGQKIRLYLDAAGYTQDSPSFSELYFGAGSHTCIGKSLSKELWKIFTNCLSGIDLKVHITNSMRKEHDYFFNGYCMLMAEIRN